MEVARLFADLLVGLGTLTLAAVAFRQIRVSRGQAKTAEAAVAEARRARIDDRSPAVTFLPEPPSRGPLLDTQRSQVPPAAEWSRIRSAFDEGYQPPNEEFVFDAERNCLLWFRERAMLINEGTTTARVRIDGPGRFIEGKSAVLTDRDTVRIPPMVGSPLRREYLLGPGEVALLEWGGGHTLGEWADAHEHPDPPNPNGVFFLAVTVFGHHSGGMVDHIFIEAGARPIEPVAGRHEHWRLSKESRLGVTVHPVHRSYLVEGWTPPTHPAADRYKGTEVQTGD